MRFLLQYSFLFLAVQAANVQKIIVEEAFNKAVAQYKAASSALEEQLPGCLEKYDVEADSKFTLNGHVVVLKTPHTPENEDKLSGFQNCVFEISHDTLVAGSYEAIESSVVLEDTTEGWNQAAMTNLRYDVVAALIG